MSAAVNQTSRPVLPPVELVVVGAGIVGLAHAVEAHSRGLSVVVVERDERAVGASIRNFGHICATAQQGRAYDYAQLSREQWISLAGKAGFDVQATGTVIAARHDDEVAVLREFAEQRGATQVCLLDRAGVESHLPTRDESVIAGAWLPMDLRVDPRAAVPAIANWLAAEGVKFRYGESVQAFEPGLVRTNGGDIRCDRVIVAVGHDVDRLFPDIAKSIDMQRCVLHMLQVEAPQGGLYPPAVLSGLSILRYAGLASCPSAVAVRERFARDSPELLDVGMNLMFTQRPDGDLVVGDTHTYATTHDPFKDDALDDLILRESARLLGVSALNVRLRWRGVYASSSQTDFLNSPAYERVRVVSVTSGIGLTTAFGLAADVLDDFLTDQAPATNRE